MKSKILLTALLGIFLFACTKPKEDTITDESSYIVVTKYPCGPSCDGLAWILQTPNGNYETTNLPDNFKENELPVRVAYSKTGRVAAQWKGTGEELVNIISISKR
jgi:hypothetical protein